MRTLVVDDDFISRKILVTLLSKYGQCDVAINGKEAIDAFKMAWDEKDKYDLICLDIMLPEINGQEVLKAIRHYEEQKKIVGSDGVKIIMTTALGDSDNIKAAFREQCEAYLVKPIEKQKLLDKLMQLGLVTE